MGFGKKGSEIMTKILLVEDDKTIVANLTEFLNNEGYIVRSVTGQTAAMNLLTKEKADLVLLDVCWRTNTINEAERNTEPLYSAFL